MSVVLCSDWQGNVRLGDSKLVYDPAKGRFYEKEVRAGEGGGRRHDLGLRRDREKAETGDWGDGGSGLDGRFLREGGKGTGGEQDGHMT